MNRVDAAQLRIDFDTPRLRYRLRRLNREMLLKAVGFKPDAPPTVIDATAGLGIDAWLLAAAGCPITLLERHAILVRLLEDGLQRACRQTHLTDIAARIDLIHTDSVPFLQTLAPTDRPDVVYLDPMFPRKRKSAAVKKNMRLLQTLLSAQPRDEASLLAAAVGAAKKRVAVKRPLHAAPLADRKPDYRLTGRSNRFDVYLPSIPSSPSYKACSAF